MGKQEVTILEKDEISVRNESQKIINEAKSILVTNNEEYEYASSFLKNIKQGIKQVEGYWKEPKDQASRAHKSICAKEKEMLKPLEEAEKHLKNEISEYLLILEDEKKKLEVEIKSTTGNDVILDSSVPKVNGISSKKDFDIEIIDINQIPAVMNGVRLLIPNEIAIRQLVKLADGNIEIPGIKIIEKKVISVRG